MALVCVFSLVACGGNVKDVKTTDCLSEIYSDAEIESAIDVAINYFKKNCYNYNKKWQWVETS